MDITSSLRRGLVQRLPGNKESGVQKMPPFERQKGEPGRMQVWSDSKKGGGGRLGEITDGGRDSTEKRTFSVYKERSKRFTNANREGRPVTKDVGGRQFPKNVRRRT